MDQNVKTIEMRRADWEKWDAALRSGKYEQGVLSLETKDGKYCCLGVLQHCLAGGVERYLGGGPRRALTLPTLEWLRIHGIFFRSHLKEFTELSRAPSLLIDGAWRGADGANDHGVSFVAIADAIKKVVKFTD